MMEELAGRAPRSRAWPVFIGQNGHKPALWLASRSTEVFENRLEHMNNEKSHESRMSRYMYVDDVYLCTNEINDLTGNAALVESLVRLSNELVCSVLRRLSRLYVSQAKSRGWHYLLALYMDLYGTLNMPYFGPRPFLDFDW